MKGIGVELPRAAIGLSRWRRFRAAVDWPLVVTVMALCAVGLLNLYSATRGLKNDAKFSAQVQWMLVGAVGFVVLTAIDYRALVRGAWLALGVASGLLVVARFAGGAEAAESSHGVTYRWLHIGGMGIQPSELVKITAILALARMLSNAEPENYAPRMLALRLGALAVPILMIAAQPDLGTAVLLSLMVLSIGFLAMPSVWPMVYVTAGGLLAIPILWEKLHGYQKDRILGFIDCNASVPGNLAVADKALRDMCWHTHQSIYAVGSGKIWGKGFLGGTQNQFNFVPEHWTDFPFCVWAEEWGFVGSVFLLAVFAFLIAWTLNVALSARDRMGAVICLGVAAMTFWHVVVNIAMVLGLAPVVGVTLPFVSYGGSSLISFFLGMGLVANVSLRKHGY